MEEMNLSQIQQQMDLQVGEQLGQIKQKLNESLPNEVDWQSEEKVWEVSKKILQETGMIQNRFVDEYGYLVDSERWSTGVAEHLAREEGVEMTEAHWEIILFLREYYEEYRTGLSGNVLIKAISRKLGPEKGNKEYLYGLFQRSSGAQANKIAGIPRPHGVP